MRPKYLYKYFSELKWAEAFINGEIRFRTLSYFRDYEDAHVREDQCEGTSIFRPQDGLTINNLTQGTIQTIPHAFVATAKQDEIFIYCLSRSFNDDLRTRFCAVACVLVQDIKALCDRLEAALPSNATFPGRAGREKIGHRVTYYNKPDEPGPRWALPDVIATSKLSTYAWQDEFRLVFSLTDALRFENVDLCLTQSSERNHRGCAEHPFYDVSAGGLHDICRLHKF